MGLYILRLIVLAVCTWAGAVIGLTQGSTVSGIIGAAVALVAGVGLCRSLNAISEQFPCGPICMAWQGSWWGFWPAL